jgi:hypothetical protein
MTVWKVLSLKSSGETEENQDKLIVMFNPETTLCGTCTNKGKGKVVPALN